MTNEGTVLGAAGNAIAYSIDGPAGAPFLVLSNSLATDRRMWQPQLAAFAKDRRVLRYDTRGHGKSAVVDASYGFKDLAADVVRLMSALDIETADFVGLSLGGMTGLALAVHFPERMSRVICCDARADAPDPYKAMWDGNIARLKEGGVAALCNPTAERWFTEGFRTDPANAQTMALVKDMIMGTPDTGYARTAECLKALDLLPHLGKIDRPTHFIVGDKDPAAPLAVMQAMADATPGAALSVIPDAAHLSNMEQPAEFSETVLKFLNT